MLEGSLTLHHSGQKEGFLVSRDWPRASVPYNILYAKGQEGPGTKTSAGESPAVALKVWDSGQNSGQGLRKVPATPCFLHLARHRTPSQLLYFSSLLDPAPHPYPLVSPGAHTVSLFFVPS